jgi:D-arabinose 1-dehydrogenase-like Zn-dependent alcohol dehydrogenase
MKIGYTFMRQKFIKGQQLGYSSETNEYIYLIKSGQVKMEIRSEYSPDEEEEVEVNGN